MKITRRSPHTGELNTFDLSLCRAQIERHQAGKPIHLAFANLEEWERKFYLTGLTPKDSKVINGEETLFTPGDRVVHNGNHGFVLRYEPDRHYAVKIDKWEAPISVSENELTKE